MTATSSIRDIPYREIQRVHTYTCQPLSYPVEVIKLPFVHIYVFIETKQQPDLIALRTCKFCRLRTNIKPQYHTLSIHKSSCILPSSLRELSTTSNCRPEKTAAKIKMRPDGPRDPVAGPNAGPEPPFPVKLFGPVIRGFGRGSKEVRKTSPIYSKFLLSHSKHPWSYAKHRKEVEQHQWVMPVDVLARAKGPSGPLVSYAWSCA